jgi:hypothetical protein
VPLPEREPGQLCYEAYIADIGDGEALVHDRLRLSWTALTVLEQAHWRAAEQAVLESRGERGLPALPRAVLPGP